jgi:hypothetical protein
MVHNEDGENSYVDWKAAGKISVYVAKLSRVEFKRGRRGPVGAAARES